LTGANVILLADFRWQDDLAFAGDFGFHEGKISSYLQFFGHREPQPASKKTNSYAGNGRLKGPNSAHLS
jgi:hypothetical protein